MLGSLTFPCEMQVTASFLFPSSIVYSNSPVNHYCPFSAGVTSLPRPAPLVQEEVNGARRENVPSNCARAISKTFALALLFSTTSFGSSDDCRKSPIFRIYCMRWSGANDNIRKHGTALCHALLVRKTESEDIRSQVLSVIG